MSFQCEESFVPQNIMDQWILFTHTVSHHVCERGSEKSVKGKGDVRRERRGEVHGEGRGEKGL